MKQTAVEWLFQVWVEQEHIAPEQWEMAKEMEKEQIIKTFKREYSNPKKYGINDEELDRFAISYYNKNFKSE